jgi:hypothetical protein
VYLNVTKIVSTGTILQRSCSGENHMWAWVDYSMKNWNTTILILKLGFPCMMMKGLACRRTDIGSQRGQFTNPSV